MIDTLIWGLVFIFMSCGLGGSAVLCVRMTEQGKNQRLAEVEKTKRQGMDNAWQLEREKLQTPSLGNGRPSTVTFDLAGGDDSWKSK